MPLRNVKIHSLPRTPPFRKIALGTWTGPGDPQIYGTLEIDLTKAYAWRERLPASAPKVTVTHMIARAIAVAMEKYPDLNGFIRFKKIYVRDSIDIFFQVAVQHASGRDDLAGVRLTSVNTRSVPEIALDMSVQLERVRQKKDTALQKTSSLLGAMPSFLVGLLLSFTSFVSYLLNIRFPGMPPDLFGGCMITNVGSFGLDVAYAPLVPYSRVPLILLVGQAKKRPVVVEDRIEAREIVTVNATIDHRFCDGSLLAKMVRVINEVFDNPDQHFGTWRDAAPEPATPGAS
jgi:pyruvate/2-oxoglutarate dehydrogenase complex dihydrolipoamide acyltransferase (E2) component